MQTSPSLSSLSSSISPSYKAKCGVTLVKVQYSNNYTSKFMICFVVVYTNYDLPHTHHTHTHTHCICNPCLTYVWWSLLSSRHIKDCLSWNNLPKTLNTKWRRDREEPVRRRRRRRSGWVRVISPSLVPTGPRWRRRRMTIGRRPLPPRGETRTVVIVTAGHIMTWCMRPIAEALEITTAQ